MSSMTSTATMPTEVLDDPRDVLAFARSCQVEADRAQANQFIAAAVWAEQHPPESIHDAATWLTGGYETPMVLAGPGAPLVAEFCIAEFALAIGRSTDSGRALVAHAVEVKYRLPRTWARIVSGDLQVWRARRIAELTLRLTAEAAAFVDAQVAPFAHRIGIAALERLVEEAIARFMPETAAESAEAAAERRRFDIDTRHVSFDGTVLVEGELDLADALDLEDAVTRGAASLKAGGSEQGLDVRRSQALGELARHQLALDLQAGAEAPKGSSGANAPKPRQVILYVHLSEAAIRGETGLHLARVENHRLVVTADQVKTWCANPDTNVVVKPVIDLDEHVHVEAYEAPERLDEQTGLINHSCVFPWCTRPARACDSEHCVAYDRGGTTCSCNIAPLCRRHHRLKTHTTWRYTILEPGTFLWSSPHGYQLLRDHHGTLDVSADTRPRPPEHCCTAPHPAVLRSAGLRSGSVHAAGTVPVPGAQLALEDLAGARDAAGPRRPPRCAGSCSWRSGRGRRRAARPPRATCPAGAPRRRGRARRSLSSGTPMTAQAATAGCRAMAFSTSTE